VRYPDWSPRGDLVVFERGEMLGKRLDASRSSRSDLPAVARIASEGRVGYANSPTWPPVCQKHHGLAVVERVIAHVGDQSGHRLSV
jgi:hypothetical protein